MVSVEEPIKAEPKPNGAAKQPRRAQEGISPEIPRRAARKPAGDAAYHARGREARSAADASLIEATRSNPGASIGDLATAIGKSRTSTVSGLGRLPDAGQAESVEGKWRLTEPETPRDPPPKWIAPLHAGREHRAHA
jgi:hypothetical protein